MLFMPFMPLIAALSNRFETRYHAGTYSAVAAIDSTAKYPKHCSLAVIGAGWGGAYIAWRLAVDTPTINASDVCVFEANGRVGGRILSLKGLPSFADLAVDVGGYRFQETQKLPADLVWKALKLNTACYDWNCAAQCEGTTCYVIKDAYGNNAGYATPIETMLTQLEEAGAGRQVFFASRLIAVHKSQAGQAPSASTLTFGDGSTVTADSRVASAQHGSPRRVASSSLKSRTFASRARAAVVLNMPGNAIEGLSNDSVVLNGTLGARDILY